MASENADRLSALMELAIEGDQNAARSFLEQLLASEIVVPSRNQVRPLTDAPKYPNEILDILGVQAKEKVFVPVFSAAEYVLEWCGTALKTRSLKFSELLNLIPENWWLAFNPGCGVEKEFSPWEIGELKNGKVGIDAIIEDFQAAHTSERGVRLIPVAENELGNLKKAVNEFGRENSGINAVYALKEEGVTSDGEKTEALILALDGDPKLIEGLYGYIGKSMIGEMPLRIIPKNNVGEALLRHVVETYPPIYKRRSLIEDLIKVVSRFLTRRT